MRKALLAALLALGMVAVPAATASTLGFFHTPNQNVGCDIFAGNKLAPTYARCDVEHHKWVASKQPKNCHLDYGNGVEIDANSKAHYTCAGDTVLHQGKALAKGKSLTVGSVTCKSLAGSAVKCVNHKSHHGFKVSRTAVKLF